MVDEIVITDDCSTDHTYESVLWVQEKTSVPIKYYKNKTHKEASYSRMMSLHKASNDLAFTGDDDCLFDEYFLLGAMATYLKLIQKDTKTALINFNVFDKATYPMKSIPIKKIGYTDFKNIKFGQNFHFFPEEYLNKPEYIDADTKLLKPIKVKLFRGVNLCNRHHIIDVGNYTDLSMWKYGYSEHLELSKKITDNGYSIYHQPDPRIYTIHLNYGGKSHDVHDKRCFNKNIKGTPYKLKYFVKQAEKERSSSGTRSNATDFHYVEIGTLFSFYLKISKKLGLKFALNEHDYFVTKEHVFSLTPKDFIQDKEKRFAIWRNAIAESIKITEKQTGKKYGNLFSDIINIVRK